MGKTKIVLDADVVIDFKDAGRLFDLPRILPKYEFVILDVVMNEELGRWPETRDYINHRIEWFKNGPNISIINWIPTSEERLIYATLLQTKGKGESACMAYCQTHKDVLASCNLRDTKKYCEENGIRYLTFHDLLWYAYKNRVMTAEECNQSIKEVIEKGNRIPTTRIEQYKPMIEDL